MTNDLTTLTDQLFIRYPFDDPKRIFELATNYLEYKKRYLAGERSTCLHEGVPGKQLRVNSLSDIEVLDESEQKAKEALERLAINSTKA